MLRPGEEVSVGSTAVRSVLQPRTVTRVPELDEELDENSLATYEQVLAHAPIGFALFDRELRFQHVNERLAVLHGIAREEHEGRTARELLPGMPRVIEGLEAALASGKAAHGVDVSGRTRASIDRPRDLVASFIPVRDRRVVGVAMFVEDVTASRELEQRMDLLHQRTHNAAQIREEIMAIVSHDMRGPLDTILSCIDQVSRKFPIADRWRQTRVLLDTVRRSVERVNHLVSELHDLAALQTGRLGMHPAQHDVFSLVGDAMRVLQPLAGDRPLRLESDVATGVRVRCDRDRIHQVLSGLVQNAIKFTPAGGAVTLRVEVVSGNVRFLVRDGGPGGDANDDAPVFDRFWRSRQDGQGSGLGLQIAREIVRAHGGEIGVESRLGQGNVSYFTLPCVGA